MHVEPKTPGFISHGALRIAETGRFELFGKSGFDFDGDEYGVHSDPSLDDKS
jgi:hypothetical protein